MSLVTRFAPSPTGYLHLGHALSALTGWRVAREECGRFLLRIEDIDAERCRPEYEAAIYQDLAWLGIGWEQPSRRQSDHLGCYAQILAELRAQGLVYPCFCSRKALKREAAAGGMPEGPDGPVYPGHCRALPPGQAAERLAHGEEAAWRLDMAKAARRAGPLTWRDRLAGIVQAAPERFGDVILGRKDMPTSYHLSVVADDFLQGVTLVTRGMDLFAATDVHRLLQTLLDYPAPEYLHHRLILDPETDWKLSKRDGAFSLRAMRQAGMTPEDVRNRAEGG